MRFKQFSLRTLLISIFVICVGFGWFASNSIASRNEERLIAKIDARRVAITDSSTQWLCGAGLKGIAVRKPTGLPNRIFAALWPQTFERVTDLELYGKSHSDDVLHIVSQLPHLESLKLRNTSITRGKLEEFKNLNPHIAVEDSNDQRRDALGKPHQDAPQAPK